MLEPQSRVVLTDQLRPPEGFHLDAGVGTTFTLDMTAALVPPLAFAAFGARAGSDPLAVMEAVRACTERLDIFCQAGQILIPRTATDLMAFLEPMVHPVVPRSGFLFHPKVWVLRYADDEGRTSFRMVCSSRNLVHSTAWDAAVTLDGELGARPDPANRPLAEFVRSLPGRTVSALAGEPLDDARLARIDALADDVMRVRWEPVEGSSGQAFHAWGVPGLRAPAADFSGYRHLVISPFMDDEGLRDLTRGSRSVVVVSRPEALDRLTDRNLAADGSELGPAWNVLDPLAGLAPADEAAGDDDAPAEPAPASGAPAADAEPDRAWQVAARERSGLHAKITVVERNNGEAHLFVGSPNATRPAYNGNVEFAVELIGREPQLGRRALLAEDRGALRRVLQEYRPAGDDAPTPEDEAEHELSKVVRNVAAVPFVATVQPSDEDFELRLTSDRELPLNDGYSAVIGPLTLKGKVASLARRSAVDHTFTGIPLADITPFFTITVTAPGGLVRGAVIHARLVNDPEGRLDEVLARQIKGPADFLRFLRLILALAGGSAAWLQGGTVEAGEGAAGAGASFATAGVLESVVRALATSPASLDPLDSLVRHLSATERGRAVIPEGFDELWRNVCEARKNWEKR